MSKLISIILISFFILLPTVETNAAISFDGTGDFFGFGDILDFERTDAFSIGFWIYNRASSGNRQTVTKWDSASGERGWQIFFSDADGLSIFRLRNTTGNNINIDTDAAVSDINTWVQHTVTYDGSSAAAGVTFYKDCEAVAATLNQDNLSATTVHADPLEIAGYNTGSQLFFGKMDEIRIWDKELSAAEVAKNCWRRIPNQANLVGYWRTDDNDSNVTMISFLESGAGKVDGTKNGNPTNTDPAPISYLE